MSQANGNPTIISSVHNDRAPEAHGSGIAQSDHFQPIEVDLRRRSVPKLPLEDREIDETPRRHRQRASTDVSKLAKLFEIAQTSGLRQPATPAPDFNKTTDPDGRPILVRSSSGTSAIELQQYIRQQDEPDLSGISPRDLLLRRNPFATPPQNPFDDPSEGSSEISDYDIWDDPVWRQAYEQYPQSPPEEEEVSEDVESKPQRTFTAFDYPDVAEPQDPARILKKGDLRKQRSFFFSIVICLNLGALMAALFSGNGTWVFAFILFIKSKDCISVLISAFGLLLRAIWRFFRPLPNVPSKWILTLIPAYSESEEQIVKTIFSLRDNDVEPHRQVMCVILDGKPRAVKSHMTSIVKSFRRPYVTSKFKLGELAIDAGFIENVPVIVFEKLKNSGKKDSLILCHDLFNAMRENAPLYTRLLREEVWTTLLPTLAEGSYFTKFDMVFCTDADSTIHKGAVRSLADALARDKNAIASCGLVLVELEPGYRWSLWNLYQQFQYTFGQYVRRRAEGFIGKVTCLPGCITMISVRPEMAGAIRKYAEPITAYPVLLHQVQYLGTDRRLTYSMLSQSKKLRTLFVPSAVSETVAPQSLLHYLSQRRRWGSNAYFNNFFYAFGERQIVITRIEATIELVRLTMVYYRIANTLLFVYGLTKEFKVMRIIPLLVVSQLPTMWFMFSVFFLERELQRRAHKLLIGFAINKFMSPFIAVTVFTKIARNLGSQVWGMTGGANATAAETTTATAGVTPAPAAATEGNPELLTNTTVSQDLEEPPRVVLMEMIVEGAVGEQLANLSETELAEEEQNEKLAGAVESMPPF